LDGDIAGRRTHELTDEVAAAFDGDVLWDEYGIDEDIVVSNFVQLTSNLPHVFPFQPFTRGFPRADIHEMLSSDLLHQVIKGTFKDHLVTWVGEYLYLEHSKAEADAIMDEIDRRYATSVNYRSIFNLYFPELPRHQRSHVCGGLSKDGASSNGQGTTPKRS
jgi:hypothetical protein